MDAFTGTAGNDSFVADETTTAVVSLADTISGGAGSDTLTITNSKSVVPQLTGVETVVLNTIAGDFNASSATGLTKLSVLAADGDNTFTVPAGASINLQSVALKNTANTKDDVVLAYAATDTSATVGLNGVTSAGTSSDLAIKGAKLTTLNIATSGADSTVDALLTATDTAIDSYVITGTAALTITDALTLAANTTTKANVINASALTGALTLTLPALNADQNLTISGSAGVNTLTFGANDKTSAVVATTQGGKDVIGITQTGNAVMGNFSLNTGAGDDTVTLSEIGTGYEATTNKKTFALLLGDGNDTLNIATGLTEANLTENVTFDGGAGVDTLGVLNAEYLKLFDGTTDVAVTGFETLNAKDAGTYDVSKIAGLTAVTLSTTNSAYTLTNLNATQAAAITLTADPSTGVAINASLKDSSGKADVATLTYAHATANTAFVNNAMVLSGFETVNLVNNDGTGTISSKIATGAAVTTLNLSGTGTGTHTIDTANLSALTKFDASNVAGSVALTTAATQPATFTLSGFADTVTLTGSTGAATFALGAGKDTLTGAQADIAAATINAGADSDTLVVSDNATTTNTLTIADATFANVTGFEVLDVGSKNIGATSWTLGGYANAIATANGGVLTATATTTGGTAAGDGYTLDATGLSVSNSINFTLKDTAVTAANANAIKVTSGAGADTIVISEAKAASVATITVDAGAGNNTVTTTAITGATKVTTGGGADTVTVTSAGTAASSVVISTGAGADTITVTETGAAGADAVVSITAGAGADTIKLTVTGAAGKAATTLVFAAGDSIATAYDSVTGFTIGDASKKADVLDFVSATVASNAAAVDGSDFGAAKSHSITGGLITFGANNSYTSGTAFKVTPTNLSDVLGYLHANVAVGEGVIFNYDANSDGTNDGTFAFSANATSDQVVYLVGVVGTSLATTGTTAGLIGIA